MGPRVNDGHNWIDIDDPKEETGAEVPTTGDGTIFVSLATYRDGERCGQALKSLFENAAEPDKIVVGVVEQNAPEDKFCFEVYCETFGIKTYQRKPVREGVTKVVPVHGAKEKCPRHEQVRLVAFHNIQAKGPMLTRSLARKVLGNQEFCSQVDAHTEFATNWDAVAKLEWRKTKNEFAVLSNVPAKLADKNDYVQGGSRHTEVPRQCAVRFLPNGFPDYVSPADGKVTDISKPLLGHGWSAAFSFAKCHLEENVPYDNFALYAMPVEQFSRYARMWTRGYDVYTPTRNIVFHDYGEQTNGHGNNEWFKRMRDRFRQATITRVKTALQIPGGQTDANDQANLGIFGLGKRRTMDQLQSFVNVDLQTAKGNVGASLKCTGHERVPYDASISPAANLFSNPDNLDPQPEYPLRTNLLYYEQVTQSIPLFDVAENDPSGARMLPGKMVDSLDPAPPSDNVPPIGLVLILWAFGLVVWCLVFSSSSSGRESEYCQAEKYP